MEGSELSCSFPSSTDWGWPDAPTPHAPLKLPPPHTLSFPGHTALVQTCLLYCWRAGSLHARRCI